MFRRFLHYYKPYRKILAFIIIGSLIHAGLDLVFPLVLRHILNVVLPTKNILYLCYYSVFLLLMYTVGYAINYMVMYRGKVMGSMMENDMRMDIFKHIESLSFRYFDNSKTGQLLSRVVGDISEIGMLAFRGPNDLIVCLFIMSGTLIILFCLNWRMALVTSILLLYKTYSTYSTNRKMKAAFRKNRVKVGNISGQVEDSISGIRLVKSFTNEAYELEKFKKTSNELLEAKVNTSKLIANFSSGVNYFTQITYVVILLYGGYLISNNLLELSDFITFFLYVNIFVRPVFRLTILAEVYQKGVAGFGRFCEIMDEKPALCEEGCQLKFNGKELIHADKIDGAIEFKNVSFGYEKSKEILSNLNLKIECGERVAFVGPTGAGKSTIGNLIPRFYEVTDGAITIGGHDIREYDLKALRKNVGIVQQDVFIFSESIRENIAYGKIGATEDEIIAAAKEAEIHDFIMSLPKGYDTHIGERGVKISGGQKQRISIARIFLKNPPILILDEATSALDNETEKKIQKALNALSKNRTTLTIAHRLATIQKANKIFVLTNKGIEEEGTHEELLKKNGAYAKLYNAQFRQL